jgi:hypothetical protein
VPLKFAPRKSLHKSLNRLNILNVLNLPRATSCPVKFFGQKLEQPLVTSCPMRNFGKSLNSLNIPQIIPWKNVLPRLRFLSRENFVHKPQWPEQSEQPKAAACLFVEKG